MVTCPNCRSPVEVPGDHYDATIRCGICWAMVAIAPRERPVTTSMLLDDDLTATPVIGDPFRGIAGRPAKGMAPLEDLLRRVSARVPTLLLAAEVPLAVEEPRVVALPAKPRKTRREDDDVRRKRGVAKSSSSMSEPPPEIQGLHRSNTLLIILSTLLLFAVAFVMAKQFLR